MLRSIATWTLRLGVSAGLLYALFHGVDTHVFGLRIHFEGVDFAQLWEAARSATLAWFLASLGVYLVMTLIGVWRWRMLLAAQHVDLPFSQLLRSFLVAMFFNNFLPSNIGGDVIRIRDTAVAVGSKTLAATVILADRGIGLVGLVFVAASAASFAGGQGAGPVSPFLLWAGLLIGIIGAVAVLGRPHALRPLLSPLRVFHQEWVEERIERLVESLRKFRNAPGALGRCFGGAVFVQLLFVGFYAGIARALHLDVPIVHLAVIVPLTFVVQMLPVSLNGFGVREATWAIYFTRVGLPRHSALLLSLLGAALIALFSLAGAVAYLTGGPRTKRARYLPEA